MTDLSHLVDAIHSRHRAVQSPAIDALQMALLEQYGTAMIALLFYGSCLRSGDHQDGLVDLYVIVDSYRHTYGRWLPALANKLLPPNVFYLEAPTSAGVVRAKYAIVSLEDLEHDTSRRCFHSYFWARFAQPTGIAYTRTPQVERRIYTAFAQAVHTFITRTLPRLPASFEAGELWQQGLLLTYSAELRAERPERVIALYAASPEYYLEVLDAALNSLPYRIGIESTTAPRRLHARIPKTRRVLNRGAWALRRAQGKLLSVLRLLKALFTFQAGVEYILWKVERHSGVKAEVPERLQKHPLLASLVLVWQIRRRGGFR
jgi:hypothetical protein